MQKFKFSQLSEQAKLVAATEYREGIMVKFFDDTDNIIPSISECYELCEDTEDDVVYDISGNLIYDEE